MAPTFEILSMAISKNISDAQNSTNANNCNNDSTWLMDRSSWVTLGAGLFLFFIFLLILKCCCFSSFYDRLQKEKINMLTEEILNQCQAEIENNDYKYSTDEVRKALQKALLKINIQS